MPGRPVPGDAVPGARVRGRARRALAVERRGGAVPGGHRGRRGRLPRACRPGRRGGRRRPPRPARSAPPAAACGCGACTCPTAARSPTRTSSTSSTGWPRCGRRPPAGWPRTPRRQVALVGDWNIAPAGRRRLGHGGVRALHPRLAAGARRLPRRRRRGVHRRRPPARPGPGVYTYWDYTQLRFPRREGMRIDFVLGSPALAARVTGASIDREERKGKGASDHAPVVVDLAG